MFLQAPFKHINVRCSILTLVLLLPKLMYGGITSRVIDLSSGTTFTADDEFVASQELTLTVGEEFLGKGYIESPKIEIFTKKFSFTGTIKCNGTCTITTTVPFNHKMFKQKGKGKFIFKVKPLASKKEESKKNEKALEKKEINKDQQTRSITNNDQDSAYEFLEKALEYRDGNGVSKDTKKAVEYFALAAEKGNDLALAQLGIYYCEGNGVEKNPQKGIALLTKAAEMGRTDAIFYLGVCYANGDCVEKDEKKAFDLFLKGAEKDDVDAILAVAQCYCYGIGVKIDKGLANKWNNKAQKMEKTSEQKELYWKTWKAANFGI